MGQTISAQSAAVITPNDTTVFTPTRGIYVAVTGDVKADMSDGSTITFVGLTGNMVHPIAVRRVYATGTTATGVVGLY